MFRTTPRGHGWAWNDVIHNSSWRAQGIDLHVTMTYLCRGGIEKAVEVVGRMQECINKIGLAQIFRGMSFIKGGAVTNGEYAQEHYAWMAVLVSTMIDSDLFSILHADIKDLPGSWYTSKQAFRVSFRTCTAACLEVNEGAPMSSGPPSMP